MARAFEKQRYEHLNLWDAEALSMHFLGRDFAGCDINEIGRLTEHALYIEIRALRNLAEMIGRMFGSEK